MFFCYKSHLSFNIILLSDICHYFLNKIFSFYYQHIFVKILNKIEAENCLKAICLSVGYKYEDCSSVGFVDNWNIEL